MKVKLYINRFILHTFIKKNRQK